MRTIYEAHKPVVILPAVREEWHGKRGAPSRGFLTRSTRAVTVTDDVTTIVNAPRKERMQNTPKSERFSADLRQVVTEMSKHRAESRRRHLAPALETERDDAARRAPEFVVRVDRLLVLGDEATLERRDLPERRVERDGVRGAT